MPITSFLIGIPQLMAVEDEVFALPTRACIGTTNPVDATLEESVDGTTWTAVLLNTQGQFSPSGLFLRNGTTTDCTVILKAGAVILSNPPA